MAMKKKHEESHDNSERWLLTYSDLITLLMIFFVIMYALSNIDAEKYKQLSESLNSAFSNEAAPSQGNSSTGESIEVQPPPFVNENDSQELESAIKDIQEVLQEKGLSEEVSVSVRERGVVVSLENTVIFKPGSSDILPEGKNTLIEIGKIAKVVDRYIRVEGNTDNIPINTPRFPSNWELSVIRATEVTKLLIADSGIPPEKISIVGYGEYRPIMPNTTDQNRALNRRVDIVILNDKYENSESGQNSNE